MSVRIPFRDCLYLVNIILNETAVGILVFLLFPSFKGLVFIKDGLELSDFFDYLDLLKGE